MSKQEEIDELYEDWKFLQSQNQKLRGVVEKMTKCGSPKTMNKLIIEAEETLKDTGND